MNVSLTQSQIHLIIAAVQKYYKSYQSAGLDIGGYSDHRVVLDKMNVALSKYKK